MKAAWWSSMILLTLLVALCLAWELRLAPVRAGGSWMVLKVVPLLLLARGLLHARRRTFQLGTLLIWLYFTEGVMRAWSDSGLSAVLAGMEVGLSLALFASMVWFCRVSRDQTSPG